MDIATSNHRLNYQPASWCCWCQETSIPTQVLPTHTPCIHAGSASYRWAGRTEQCVVINVIYGIINRVSVCYQQNTRKFMMSHGAVWSAIRRILPALHTISTTSQRTTSSRPCQAYQGMTLFSCRQLLSTPANTVVLWTQEYSHWWAQLLPPRQHLTTLQTSIPCHTKSTTWGLPW